MGEEVGKARVGEARVGEGRVVGRVGVEVGERGEGRDLSCGSYLVSKGTW